MTLKNLVDHYFPESIGKPLENVQLGFIEFDADGKVTTTDLKFLITIVEGKRRKDWESSIFGDEQQRSVCSQSLSFRHDACKKELSWLSPVPEAWQSDRVISFDRVIGFQPSSSGAISRSLWYLGLYTSSMRSLLINSATALDAASVFASRLSGCVRSREQLANYELAYSSALCRESAEFAILEAIDMSQRSRGRRHR